MTEPNSNNNRLSLTRRNSVENDVIKQWLNESIIKSMEKTNYPRIMFLFSIVFFFLGRDLNIFCYLVIGLTIYMLIVRTIRFYTKRMLLYFCEFCYFGMAGLLAFLIYYRENKVIWTSVYSYGTGNMAMAIVLLNNQALFTSSDHMSSAWLHFAPIITCWAIRWRHTVYESQYNSFISLENMQLENHEIVTYFVKFPLILWACWALYYFILMKVIFRGFVNSEKYQDCLKDFIKMVDKMPPARKILGDARNFTFTKYLFSHIIQFVLGIAVSYTCYINFYVNTAYVLLLIFYLFWSAGKTQQRIMNKKIEQTINRAEEGNTEGNAEDKKSN